MQIGFDYKSISYVRFRVSTGREIGNKSGVCTSREKKQGKSNAFHIKVGNFLIYCSVYKTWMIRTTVYDWKITADVTILQHMVTEL